MNAYRGFRAQLGRKYIFRMSAEPKVPFDKTAFPRGINLFGSFSQDSGLGQGCRLLAGEIERSGIPHAFIDYAASPGQNHGNHEFDGKYSNSPQYGINVFQINMHEMARAFCAMDRNIWRSHYNIAFWSWENEEFPEEWIPMISQLDEIWTPAEYDCISLRKVTSRPVRSIPYTVDAPYDETADRKFFHLPEDQFLFLMLFDYNSISERKNPFGVIRAFKSAFRPDAHEAGLVIKIANGSHQVLKEIDSVLKGYDVYFVNEVLSKNRVNALIRCCDAYVSLHRAEGFGLVLAEAMLLGVPTIATAYSANTEFQDSSRACLVKYHLRQIGKDIYPYKKNYFWAEPDIPDAAEYMKKLRYDQPYRAAIIKNASDYMHDEERIEIPVKKIRSCFNEIYGMSGAQAAPISKERK
ncbi:MAG: glycosyltransferase family 4 protein [Pyramidobacter sp.]